MNEPQNNQESDVICPFLGMPGDWQTAMDYPSRQNFCRKVKPPTAPDDSYQREFCLSSAHKQCPKYSSDISSSQADLPGSKTEKTAKRGRLPGWIIPGLIILIIALLILWLALSRLLPVITSMTARPVGDKIVTATVPVLSPTLAPSTPRALSEISPEVTMVTPTDDLEPMEIVEPTPASPHTLEVPFGTTYPLLMHRVIGGEDLISIANTYQSSVDAIRSINFNMPAELWSDTIIIIPVNQSILSGIPPMKAYEVSTDGLTLEELANEQGIDPVNLALYNDRSGDYLFQKGEWVVLPQSLP